MATLDNFTPSEAHGFPPGAVVSTPILAILVPRIQETAERDGRSAFAIVNAAIMAGLTIMAGVPPASSNTNAAGSTGAGMAFRPSGQPAPSTSGVPGLRSAGGGGSFPTEASGR